MSQKEMNEKRKKHKRRKEKRGEKNRIEKVKKIESERECDTKWVVKHSGDRAAACILMTAVMAHTF